jgi:hypothetical protein
MIAPICNSNRAINVKVSLTTKSDFLCYVFLCSVCCYLFDWTQSFEVKINIRFVINVNILVYNNIAFVSH